LRTLHQKRHEITIDRVKEEFARLAFSNMLDFVTLQADGTARLDLSKISREQAAAIQEMTFETVLSPDPEAVEAAGLKHDGDGKLPRPTSGPRSTASASTSACSRPTTTRSARRQPRRPRSRTAIWLVPCSTSCGRPRWRGSPPGAKPDGARLTISVGDNSGHNEFAGVGCAVSRRRAGAFGRTAAAVCRACVATGALNCSQWLRPCVGFGNFLAVGSPGQRRELRVEQ
jgi:hypothetical protein